MIPISGSDKTRIRARDCAAVALTACALLAAPAAAEDAETAAPEWDQAKVTALAEELADAADDLHRELRRQTSQSQIASGMAQAMLQFRDNIKVARDNARSLARSLADGQGRDETSATYRRLMALVRNARETGRRLFVKAPATDYIEQANAALDGLAPYYPDIRPSA